jgi:flagellar biosynthesis protein FliQ
MQLEQLGTVVVQALQLALWLSLPALGAAVIAGAISGALQAATQVQDAALGFVPRLLAVALALFLSAAFMGERLTAFTSALWRGLPQ